MMQLRYEYALSRIEELLPLVGEDTSANDPLALWPWNWPLCPIS